MESEEGRTGDFGRLRPQPGSTRGTSSRRRPTVTEGAGRVCSGEGGANPTPTLDPATMNTPPQPSSPDAPDTDVLTRYVDRNHEALLGFIRSKVGDDALAEDILQDSLLKALRAAPEIDDEGSLETWLYRVVRNAITDAYRRHAAAARRLERYALDQPDPAGWPEVPSEADETALCECVRGLLPALKPEYAEVLEAIDLG